MWGVEKGGEGGSITVEGGSEKTEGMGGINVGETLGVPDVAFESILAVWGRMFFRLASSTDVVVIALGLLASTG